MMKTTKNAFGAGLVALVFLLAAACGPLAAAPPNDDFYAGGPDGTAVADSWSETWHLFDIDTGAAPLPGEHPFKGHGEKDDDKLSLQGGVITLRSYGNAWFLVPHADLGWTPNVIPLDTHGGYVPWNSADQWRWVSRPAVMIDGHAHAVCVGYPNLHTSRRDDDQIQIAVVDWETRPRDPDCGDGLVIHPGHAGGNR